MFLGCYVFFKHVLQCSCFRELKRITVSFKMRCIYSLYVLFHWASLIEIVAWSQNSLGNWRHSLFILWQFGLYCNYLRVPRGLSISASHIYLCHIFFLLSISLFFSWKAFDFVFVIFVSQRSVLKSGKHLVFYFLRTVLISVTYWWSGLFNR